jgi:hypothetical protein
VVIADQQFWERNPYNRRLRHNKLVAAIGMKIDENWGAAQKKLCITRVESLQN